MSRSFLQSPEWEKFQESVGRKVFRVENKLVIKHNLPLGLSYFYCPRSEFKDKEEFKNFFHEIKKLAKSENAVFVRIEPNINSNNKNLKPFNNLAIEQCNTVQPQDTLLLDLNQSENEILDAMHPKTRYNIRLAEKHQLHVIKSTNVKDIETFYQLAIKTSERDKFSYHPKAYYQKMMETLGKDKMMELYIAYAPNHKSQILNPKQIPISNNQNSPLNADPRIADKLASINQKPISIPIAAILVLHYKDTAIYLHGASDHKYRKFMAPYLLQWQAIKDAKKRGCKTYDFWGIAPRQGGEILNPKSEILNKSQATNPKLKTENRELKTSQEHSWSGITRFKMGFAPSGQILHYPDASDLIFQSFWYRLYKLVKG